MFVGEAPGRDEDLQGEPFVGRAGQLLTKIIEAIGMNRSDVYIANVLKCRPPENRNPLPEEIALCMPYLLKQIEMIQPKVLCALGTFAAQTLLNTKAPVGTLRGKFHDYKSIPMMVTYHPAYLLRNSNDKAKVWEDMKKVRDLLGQLTQKKSNPT
jgi:DNA polymerase